MTKIFLLFIFLAILTCCRQNLNSGEKDNNATELNKAALVTAEFKISGMTCTGCENTIKANIEKLEGIQSVTASYTTGNAIVTFDTTKTNMPRIAETIDNCGYKAESFSKK